MDATDGFLTNLTAAAKAGSPLGRADLTALAQCDDPAAFRKLGRTLKSANAEAAGLAAPKVGVLATYTVGPLEPILRASLAAGGMLPTFTIGDYAAFDLTLSRSDDPLFDAGQDVLFCTTDASYFLPKDWSGSDVDALTAFITERVQSFRGLLADVVTRGKTTVLTHTVPLPAVVRDGLVSWSGRAKVSRCWAQLNAAILELAEEHSAIAVADFVSSLADEAVAAQDDRLLRFADLPYTDAALMVLAREARRFLQAKTGLSRKVLALDLDNTQWGGVLGEVGAAGVELGGLYPGNSYTEFQRSVLRLRDQGVILALASKNDAEHVESALTEHPEVLLRPEMFSASAVNWSPKSGNLKAMAAQLSLSPNAFVFMDDSRFERGEVTAALPEVTVIAADGDPAYLVRNLLRGGWFDTLELTDTDRKRPGLYKARAERGNFAEGFGSAEDYLKALDVVVTIAEATPFDVARIAQLAARTNQFNLTGLRFDQAETTTMSDSDEHIVLSCSVADRFGDEGMVGAAWVRKDADAWEVLNLVMSCRVLGRGVEQAMVGWLLRRAKETGVATLRGTFTPSARNTVSSKLWSQLGFEHIGDRESTQVHELAVDGAADLVPDSIQLKEK
ncbi:HAD-IIIC family phosphatase [Allokutzneria sp. A3M-2-11 16]|uniref:HAD-IIIC family phosphatase n=1 Tax=Allokutzneria sp. A3M-2-11 16 TaxID=2962043 RepID=UPI0020B8D8BA|nr:HAD-IIIC family phosphatase [Allokutzneria sp. A3M-2-11 16]MCP3799983.1 HAD-IIIC family phosphatase [Allokutzneria sp. A3M-2-11 16]